MIKIARGTGRVSVLLPCFGIVLKFFWPRTPLAALRSLVRNVFYRRLSLSSVWLLSKGSLHGLIENIQEMRLSEKSGSMLLSPTYLSFGFVNVQKYEPDILQMCPELLEQMSFLTEANIWDNIHTFANPGNFAIGKDGKLRMLDYGSPAVERLVLDFGDILHRDFDPGRRLNSTDRIKIGDYQNAWSQRRKRRRMVPQAAS